MSLHAGTNEKIHNFNPTTIFGFVFKKGNELFNSFICSERGDCCRQCKWRLSRGFVMKDYPNVGAITQFRVNHEAQRIDVNIEPDMFILPHHLEALKVAKANEHQYKTQFHFNDPSN